MLTCRRLLERDPSAVDSPAMSAVFASAINLRQQQVPVLAVYRWGAGGRATHDCINIWHLIAGAELSWLSGYKDL